MEHLSGQKKPKNWLVESILATIFCCLPFGIAGIIFATKVDSAYKIGDIAGAEEASRQAGKWTKVAFFLGIATFILSLIAMFGFGMSFGLLEGIEGLESE